MKISIGADPEIFLYHKKEKEFVSAHTLIPGTKKAPFKVTGGAVQVDGTAAEFNIHPSHSPAEFITNVDTVLSELRSMVPKELEFKFRPTVDYPSKYWQELPDDCKVLGCDPDFNINGAMNPPPQPRDGVRHGGGHIHIGWTQGKDTEDEDHFWDCQQVAIQMNSWFTGFEGIWDRDARRRVIYRGGSFRPKPYGVEIRSFSNAWLRYPVLWPWMFNTIQCVMDKIEQGTQVETTYCGGDGTMAARAQLMNNKYCTRGMPPMPTNMLGDTDG